MEENNANEGIGIAPHQFFARGIDGRPARSACVRVLGEGSVVKKRIFRIFARFSDPEFSIYILLLTEPLKKKLRGQCPDLVNAHEIYNHRPS